ncbi:MAG: hypothetical protein ACQERN_12805 [Thermodesulfobacteriota bacterium]
MAKAMPRDHLLQTVCKKLRKRFEAIGFIEQVHIRPAPDPDTESDFVVELEGQNSRHVLHICVRKNGEPKIARQAVNGLVTENRQQAKAHPVFAAPYISEAAAAICEKYNVGYMDLAGNCHICFDTVYIHTAGSDNPYKNKRRLKSLSRPKAARIIRVLLNHPKRPWKTRELARQAGVSLGLVSNVKKILQDREWIDDRRQKIVLTRPEALLEHWIASADPVAAVTYYRAKMDFIEMENAIAEHCQKSGTRCAFTGLSGAIHLASEIHDYRQVQVYANGPIDLAGQVPGFEESRDGDNAPVALIETADEGVFYGSRRVMPASRLQYCRPSEKTVQAIEAEIQTRMHIVSPVQIYFDLRTKFHRTEENEAEQIYKQAIEPTW